MVMASQPYLFSQKAIVQRAEQNQAEFVKSVDKFGLCFDPNDTSGVYDPRPNNVADWAMTVVDCAYKLVSLEEASDLENWPKPPLFRVGVVFGTPVVDEVGDAVREFARLVAEHFDEVQASMSHRLQLDKGGEGREYVPERDVECRQWLDAILTAAGSDKAGQFMAPVLAEQFMRDFIQLAKPLIALIGAGRQDFVRYLLANPDQFTDFQNASIHLDGIAGNAGFLVKLFAKWLGDQTANPFLEQPKG